MSQPTPATDQPEAALAAGIDNASVENARDLMIGMDVQVPLWDGRSTPYVNLDNAATTPPFKAVADCLCGFQRYYSSIHRGAGFKSLLSTRLYERCRELVADFIGANPEHHAVLFTQNATHSLNKLARRLGLTAEDVVVSTVMEHHSNMLPWRFQPCQVVLAGVRRDDGTLDVNDLGEKVRRHAGRVKVVAVTAASNVTGAMPPLRRIARIAHQYGAWLAVDGTQLVPHRPVRLGAPDDPDRIDFIAFSAHKMYAPFGAGVLAGRREVFEQGAPDVVGGGTVHAVTQDDVVWHDLPDRDEAGTPNVMGALALARAVQVLDRMGMTNVAAHDRDLAGHCLRRLSALRGVTIYGPRDPEMAMDRRAVIAIQADGLSHGLLAAALGHEWGIGVRNGCFCAQPYVRELLGVPLEDMQRVIGLLSQGNHALAPGLVRIGLGVYNTRDEIDYLAEALKALLADGPRARYVVDPVYRDYVPADQSVDYDGYLPL